MRAMRADTDSFDPDAPASASDGIYGLPYDERRAALVLVPVPWDATTSYRPGTARGPEAIRTASAQLDLFDLELDAPYRAGIHMLPVPDELRVLNAAARADAQRAMDDPDDDASRARVDAACGRMVEQVRGEVRRLLAAGKLVGVVGGDHSVPLGAIAALGERHPRFGILHFDAHHDLRDAYMGFAHSHASIMHNVLAQVPQVTRLVQVGIRDFGSREHAEARAAGERVVVFYDQQLADQRAAGTAWCEQAARIVAELPELVYVSFDIDGLDPRFCPHTGTPVPGGLSFDEAVHLVREVVRSGRRIVGFDLVEVAPGADGDEWDANVGMRLLYKLSVWTLASQGLAATRGA
jgi:agmatinase